MQYCFLELVYESGHQRICIQPYVFIRVPIENHITVRGNLDPGRMHQQTETGYCNTYLDGFEIPSNRKFQKLDLRLKNRLK